MVIEVANDFLGRLDDPPLYKGSNCVPVLRYYLERENYALPNAQQLKLAEEDSRLYKILIQPMDDCKLLQQFDKCDVEVLRMICAEIVKALVGLFLDVILSRAVPKRFTEWGSLLLSKEIRTVQHYIQSRLQQAMSQTAVSSSSSHDRRGVVAPILTTHWEKLSQTVMVLQLEKPSDWTYYQSTSILSPQELQMILQLRVDFSPDAVQAVAVTAAMHGRG
jgi:hypothetical protein